MTSEKKYLDEVREDNEIAEKAEQDPVMCSKCNRSFESDSEYIQHYVEVHSQNNRG